MKKLLKVVVVLVMICVLSLAGAGWYIVKNINNLAKRGIEAGGQYALGVTTTVDGVSLHPLRGELELEKLKVANPAGFSSPHFVQLGEGELDVSLGSLRSDVIEVPLLRLTGIDVNLERKDGKANYTAIMESLSKLKGSSSPSAQPGNEKRFIINQLDIEKVNVHVDMLGGAGAVGQIVGGATKVNVPIEKIQLTNVGKTGTGIKGTGVTGEELASIVIQAVLNAAAENGGGLIPSDILGDLKGSLASLDGLKDIQASVTAKAGDAAKKMGAEAQKAIDQAGEKAQKAIDDAAKKIGDGLGNLIPGQKKPEPKK